MSDTEAALLVVDDIEDNRFALSRRLARQGYLNVTTAADGQQALELLNSKPFDLVLLDIMMPNVNGYEVLAAMKADERLRHVPVIMISAVDEIDSVIRCIELGAEDYLPKPFNPTLLRARVGACLERKRLHDQVSARTAELSEALEQQTARRHLKLARRARARVPGDAGERDAHLRSQIWNPDPVRGRRRPDRLEARHTTGVRQIPSERTASAGTAQSDQPCRQHSPDGEHCRLSCR